MSPKALRLQARELGLLAKTKSGRAAARDMQTSRPLREQARRAEQGKA